MARVILICGKICSGKSYYARQLRETENAVILSTDEATFDLIDNQQGDFYNIFAGKVNLYLRKKAAEIALAGTNVILDWGFWTRAGRKEISDYFQERGVTYEWHYVEVSEEKWHVQIRERNKRIEAGEGGCDFYLNNGLLEKCLGLFEEPDRSEILVWQLNQ